MCATNLTLCVFCVTLCIAEPSQRGNHTQPRLLEGRKMAGKKRKTGNNGERFAATIHQSSRANHLLIHPPIPSRLRAPCRESSSNLFGGVASLSQWRPQPGTEQQRKKDENKRGGLIGSGVWVMGVRTNHNRPGLFLPSEITATRRSEGRTD